MPPPIVPASGPANRATVTRLTEKVAPETVADRRRSAGCLSGCACAAARGEGRAGRRGRAMDPRARPPAAPSCGSQHGVRPGAPATKTPSAEAAQKFGEVRQLGEKPNAASGVKGPAKVDDPFADLDSLEAEMARLLGREKLS